MVKVSLKGMWEHKRRLFGTIFAVVLGVAIPLFESWSRRYRGMHHLSDIVAGLLMGLGALVVLVFAARAARAAADRRDGVDVATREGTIWRPSR